jgi:diacylglycerol O-acyltransferase / trehalose O-mycolyltransferase
MTSVHRRGRPSGQRRWPLVLRWLIVITVLVSPGCGQAPPASPPAIPSEAPARTAQIVQRQHLSDRTWDLMIDSPAVGGRVPVRLLLPRRFEERPEQQWPVLYLLHGCCDTYVSWTRSTDIERLSAHLDALVVMPDGGQVGFYSDWLDGPGWETFHTSELPQLLAREYRANGRAAIAGVSMGGLGALGYAARHPGQYAVAASFSGIVHTRLSPDVARGYLRLVQSYDTNPLGLWGDPVKQPDVWKRHNPYDLTPQLGGTRLYISSGNGQPGPLDLEGAVTDQIETEIGKENTAFARRLRQLGIEAKLDLYGDGTHNWVYWQRSLHRAWPLITDALQS